MTGVGEPPLRAGDHEGARPFVLLPRRSRSYSAWHISPAQRGHCETHVIPAKAGASADGTSIRRSSGRRNPFAPPCMLGRRDEAGRDMPSPPWSFETVTKLGQSRPLIP